MNAFVDAEVAPDRVEDQPTAVRRCLTCGTRSDIAECGPCAIAEKTLWKRVMDR